MKKGKVEYSIPEFKFATSLNDSQSKLADEAYNILKSYIDGYLSKQMEVKDEEIIEDNDISDLF
jgi:hypothetical protein